MAAEVPTARCAGTLLQIMKGTDSEPPPIPTRAETTPMTLPTPNMPPVPGSSREGLGFLFRSIWVAMT